MEATPSAPAPCCQPPPVTSAWGTEARRDFAQTLSGLDVRGTGVIDAATFAAKHEKHAGAYDEVLESWKGLMDDVLKREQELGLIGEMPKKRKEFWSTQAAYFPQQYSTEVREAMEKANFNLEIKNLDDAFRMGTQEPRQGLARVHSFLKGRKFDQPDFLEHLKDQMGQAKSLGARAMT